MIKFKRLHKDAIIPKYMTPGASGFDLYSIEPVSLEQGQTMTVRTGLAVQLPVGYEMQIRPRSGMSIKFPGYISNSPATIDADYRGELKIIMTATVWPIKLRSGIRIAQGVVSPVAQFLIEEAAELDPTLRGAGGFGSTGVE